MTETEILAGLLDKETFFKLKDFLREVAFTQEGWKFVKGFEQYFNTFPTKDTIHLPDYKMWYAHTHLMRGKDEEVWKKILDNIADALAKMSVSSPVGVSSSVIKLELLCQALVGNIESKIETLRGGVAYQPPVYEEVISLIEDFKKHESKILGGVEEPDLVPVEIGELMSSAYSTAGGLQWRLPCLNTILGPLRGGDFLELGARPETGKTTFLASEATFMAPQLSKDKSVLWFNNEEQGKKVQIRIVQAALNKTLKEMDAMGTATVEEEYTKAITEKTKIKVFDKASLSKAFIKQVCKKYRPGLVIVDRMDKIVGAHKKDVRDDQRLQQIAAFLREVAKEFDTPVIGVLQAGKVAQGQKWIFEDGLYGSQTVLHAECDALLTIGRTDDITMVNSRFLNIPRNKLSGSRSTDPTRRHGRAEVLIDPERARYYEGVSKV